MEAAEAQADDPEFWELIEEVDFFPGRALAGSGLVRTFFVFTNLPRHIEWRAAEMPVLHKGLVLELDIALKNPRHPARTRRVSGPHKITGVKLVYSTSRPEAMGLTQYLELAPDM